MTDDPSVLKNPPPDSASMGDRLAELEELVAALKPAVLATHSEHGLQGLSGLIGQYRAALKEIEELRAARADRKGTPLDELASRRAGKTTGGRGRASGGSV